VRRPRKCPECSSNKLANILYGYPINSPELMEKIGQGKIVLGGCVVTGSDPDWKCIDCGAELFGDASDSENVGT